jgi:hypothetical protein
MEDSESSSAPARKIGYSKLDSVELPGGTLAMNSIAPLSFLECYRSASNSVISLLVFL